MAETDNASQICGGDRQAAQAISDVGDGDVRDVCETLRGFPSHAVKDLLSLGVCLRCILRLLGIRGELYDNCTLSLSSILSSVFGDLTDSEKHTINDASVENGKCSESPNLKELEVNEALCSLCLGILQFSYCDDKASVVRKDSAYDFASSIVELVKQEGHQIDGFSLEVSIPPVIQENEQSVCLYMKKKYESESWFQRKSLSERDSVKDALKTCMTKSLEKLLDCNSNMSTFRIRLTYTQAESSKMVQTFVERKQGCKRRKAVTGTDNDLETVDGIKVANFPSDEIAAVIESSLETCQDSGLSDRVSEPCQLVFHCCRTHIYFGGRYLKYSRNVSQTRWIIDDERMGDASVEELIGSNILPVCRGDSYKFHAAGREDIDVRMLGSGRPFLVEIQNGRHLPCDDDVKNIEEKINNLENKLVGVRNLKIMGSQGWTLMHEGEAEKQKQYAALVWISRPLKDEDFQSISSYKEMRVVQKTPIRVLHRRSPLEREKIIHWMKIEKIVGSSQYFLLHLCTQAGTYIKEFVHGDLGRTYPSIGTILGCRAEILQLDVTDVKMDCF